VTTVHSVAGTLPTSGGLITTPPFRAPHHTASDIALVGGGSVPRPGEISLAHHGVLFLDELPEFSRHTLETLRQPLEQGCVTIARAGHSATFPARVVLVGAMNPCPCGFAGSPTRRCTCGAEGVERYQRRLSGPLLDRFDLRVEIPAVPWSELEQASVDGESSAAVRERVLAARVCQLSRQHCVNATLEGRRLRQICRPSASGANRLLGEAVSRFGLSVRGVSRVLRVARTIADLGGSAEVRCADVAEALHFRGATPAERAAALG
jgi:magnesium chelatase family protein